MNRRVDSNGGRPSVGDGASIQPHQEQLDAVVNAWLGLVGGTHLRFRGVSGRHGAGSQHFGGLLRLLVVMLTGIFDQVSVAQVWAPLLDMTWCPGLFVVLAVPFVSWLGKSLRAWQEHLKVKMILRNACVGTVVVSQTRCRWSSSTLVVRQGGAHVPAVPALVEGRG